MIMRVISVDEITCIASFSCILKDKHDKVRRENLMRLFITGATVLPLS